jgi:nucleoside 2-deoxyribosyltransferase
MMTIVGGTYIERCFEPFWNERYGSGLRACSVVAAISPTTKIDYYTFADSEMTRHLELLFNNSLITNHVTSIFHSIEFHYEHPLIDPRIYPRLDTVEKKGNVLQVEGENVLYYGLIEGNAVITAKNVVYDPQSPVTPKNFSETGSTAEKIAYVINLREAFLLTGEIDPKEIMKVFVLKEKIDVLVLKMGPQGAMVFANDGQWRIPVYETPSVWPIGSGDVFAASFAYHWFSGITPVEAAKKASWHTACYCSTKAFRFSNIGCDPNIVPLEVTRFPSKQIYLAGPFFTFSERWLIDQIHKSLKGFNLNVFSPWHDVGHGIASEVVSKDLNALEQSGVIFAVLDGLDSGTLFEIGYGVKMGIPVVGYMENESLESIKMLEGTACCLDNDLTTAIYRCFWEASKHE